MGIELRAKSYKFDDETLEQIAELQSVFHPFAENPSQTLRAGVKILHKMFCTGGMIETVGALLQGLLRSQLYYQQKFDFPALAAPEQSTGVAENSDRGQRPRVVSISRRSRVHHRHEAEGVGKVAWVGFSFRKSFACLTRVS